MLSIRFSPPLLLLLGAALGGCYVRVPETVYSRCDALGSSGWTAQHARQPDVHGRIKRVLLVQGKVSLPGSGYGVSLEKGSLQRIEPRALHVLLRTDGDRDPQAQPTVYDVRAAFPYDRRVRALAIRCGDGILAEIPEIAPEVSA